MDLLNALNAVTYEPEAAIENATVEPGDDNTAELRAVARVYGQRMVYASLVRKVDGVWKVDLPRYPCPAPRLCRPQRIAGSGPTYAGG